jgi:NAD(P)-dependent dehydrogenase (short-subunit alcohol dehydrogenase family)
VVITGRDQERAEAAAAELGSNVTGIGFDLADPKAIAPALRRPRTIDAPRPRRHRTRPQPGSEYDIEGAIRLTTMKLVSYTETVHTLIDRFDDDSSVLLYGGRAKDRPYPGSTTVTTVNGGVSTMIVTFAVELAPIRFNALHPGIVGDSPYWKDKSLDAVIARTPTKRLATMADVVEASVFLLENRSVNGTNMYIDGGWMLL